MKSFWRPYTIDTKSRFSVIKILPSYPLKENILKKHDLMEMCGCQVLRGLQMNLWGGDTQFIVAYKASIDVKWEWKSYRDIFVIYIFLNNIFLKDLQKYDETSRGKYGKVCMSKIMMNDARCKTNYSCIL